MRQLFPPYLRTRRKIELQLLGICILLVFGILVFTPFRIHGWVNAHRVPLMWVEIGLLTLFAGLLGWELGEAPHRLQHREEDAEDETESPERYKFYDEKGELKLVVQPKMLYYLEAADNYVLIHYMNADKMERMMIRNTLKNIEWRFRDKGLTRCHRSYIVNLQNVNLLRKEEGEVLLDFGMDRLPSIPVSKGYGDKVIQQFSA